MTAFSFELESSLEDPRFARAGVITTPHGKILTPAFIPVGTKATVKALTPEQVTSAGAQAVLANSYHLYLQPGPEIIQKAGGLGRFMNWPGPTFTDSGGFQVLSLGSGYKKVVSMDPTTSSAAPKALRMARVNEDGVDFQSVIDGSWHRFTPEKVMAIQHNIGADICFAFDELTSLADSRVYQIGSLQRTERWAKRSLDAFRTLQADSSSTQDYQALFGVLQGANYEDLRRSTAINLGKLDFDGFGIGGAIEKQLLGETVRWVNEELPAGKPKHLLGISEPDDMFAAVAAGVDTFDCVAPTRVARNGAVYTPYGRINLMNAAYKANFDPIVNGCRCYTCRHYSQAYLSHLLRAHERLGATLLSIHNEHFIIHLVDEMRKTILEHTFTSFRQDWLARYYATKS